MKKKSIISLFVLLLGLGATTSCEDMLTPDMDRYSEGFTGRDTVNFYFGILGNVQDLIENNVLLGEVRADLADTTMYVSDSVARIAYFEDVEDGDNGLLNRAAYYKVINQCNFYLATVDTMATKNNIPYMRREFAQVQMIRAWTYMQLVQNYGRVPFITKPVDNAGTGWETNPENWADPSNLRELLMEAGLQRAYAYEETYGRPNYGNFILNASDISLPHRYTVFHGDLILGDLYLLTATNDAHYMQAATHYYNYLSDNAKNNLSSNYAATVLRNISNNKETYSTSATEWAWTIVPGSFKNTSLYSEVITLVPSAANTSIGKTLTRIQQIYGFDPTSRSVGNSTGTESGNISVIPNYKNRQVGPSKRYKGLNEEQFMAFEDARTSKVTYVDVADGRYAGSVAEVYTDAGILPFVQKFCLGSTASGQPIRSGFSFSYGVPVYRLRQVLLRYAEAINRAGFPRHAFAVLRDGLRYETMPTLMDSVKYDDAAQKGTTVFYTEQHEDGCRYIDIDELRRAAEHPEFLDFSATGWHNYGVHLMGGSDISDKDSLYNYGVTVGQRMLDEATRVGNVEDVRAYAEKLMKERYLDEDEEDAETGDGSVDDDEGEGEDPGEDIDRDEWEVITPDPVIPEDLEYQQNAVETLIADEMALETAFEGFRFFDLTRMARHKNNVTGNGGTEWLAWMIARRSVPFKSYENINVYNSVLYNKLLNEDNWYLPSPKY